VRVKYLKASFLTVLSNDALVRRVDADPDETHNMIVRQIAHLQSASLTI